MISTHLSMQTRISVGVHHDVVGTGGGYQASLADPYKSPFHGTHIQLPAAQILSISTCSFKKWESGKAVEDIGRILTICS
jgi:hypothetical protein